MSEQDELQTIGRLSKEVGGLKKRSAFIREELVQFVNALHSLILDLDQRTNPVCYQRSGPRPVVLQEYASKYSDLSKLLELVNEQDSTEKQLAYAKEKLAEVGGA